MRNFDNYLQVTMKLMCPECKRTMTREEYAFGHDCEV